MLGFESEQGSACRTAAPTWAAPLVAVASLVEDANAVVIVLG
jgi:hypothetical protein